MRPAAPLRLLLSSLCLALCCPGGARGSRGSDNHEWKKLIMVHHWPVTVCKEVENDCRDPPDYWTIHGLWPDKAEECNGSWHFHLEEIKDLMPEMKMYWPDVIHPLNHSHFWKHEWEKHGTCAAQLDALNSQKKYFGGSLDLYRDLDLNSMLQKLGIKPSINYYQVSDIKDALAGIYGVIPKIQCLPPQQEGVCWKVEHKESQLMRPDCLQPGPQAGRNILDDKSM
ncbi:ribonuclease T2 isoform X2 [Canis lupus baileyi]|uniref:ribonuclease T2 isoform X2 n=1 Tax=Canis lupus familiaris TaxID=9615 RepID=UPI0003ADEB67|nr:ribonuclease T2 isoform X2 [Canis lupus familiaris]XP_038388434.1 ribonuclease T2 isoform X2 [Canis lupus familiaris]XP_038510550.1 ribonuclease T2 isoform X2 [Canis lupus familiaris]XP_048970329.1 ribonuclease T2 isoform X2 [Canis lupus dingo]|eukprot:XP_005615628.1 ribonuclease T2 isoform X2 [Canis lupus familiaris]